MNELNELAPLLIAPPCYRDLRTKLLAALGVPNGWKPLLIGIDGVNGSGKSALAAWLSWQLNIVAIHLDVHLIANREPPEWRLDDLVHVIEGRDALGRAIIVESILLLEVLDSINRKPDYHVFVHKEGHHSGERYVNAYLKKRKPKKIADYVVKWSSAEHDRRVVEAHLKRMG